MQHKEKNGGRYVGGSTLQKNDSFPCSSWNYSSKSTPCPVCDRTKDRDCSWTEDGNRVHCHTYAKESPPASINGYHFTGQYGSSGYHGDGSAAIYDRNPDSKTISVPSSTSTLVKNPVRAQKRIRPEKTTTFIYKGQDGQEVVKVVRRDDGKGKKQCPMYHYDQGKWIAGLPKQIHNQVPLYRIHEPLNLDAANRGRTILLVEGEGKVDLLMTMGIPATCSLGGAGKWKKYGHENYLEQLGKAEVVICPDRDVPGMNHANDIYKDLPDARWLYAYPDSREWEDLPQSKGLDIADWIEESNLSAGEVLAAIEQCRHQSATLPNDKADEYLSTPTRFQKEFKLIESKFSHRLRFNSLTKEIELDGDVLEMVLVKAWLSINEGLPLRSGKEDILDAIVLIAKQNTYNPVTNYLDQVHQTFGDDTRILDGFANRYFGTTEELYQTYIVKFFIAMVARAYEPGCKFDNVLVLKSPEGFRKSGFFETIATKPWFDGSMGSQSDKDEVSKMHQVWLSEWAELDGFDRKDVGKIKAFITRSEDRVRPPYGKKHEIMKRQSVLTGTTNEDNFLTSTTGNRRFWVIPVAKKIDLDLLRQERDRIFAAAVSLYRAGKQWWLTPEQEILSANTLEQYQDLDPWFERVQEYVRVLTKARTEDILLNAIQLPLAQIHSGSKRRVAGILRQLGWSLTETKDDEGNRVRGWQKN